MVIYGAVLKRLLDAVLRSDAGGISGIGRGTIDEFREALSNKIAEKSSFELADFIIQIEACLAYVCGYNQIHLLFGPNEYFTKIVEALAAAKDPSVGREVTRLLADGGFLERKNASVSLRWGEGNGKKMREIQAGIGDIDRSAGTLPHTAY